jgi:hypothetical protein
MAWKYLSAIPELLIGIVVMVVAFNERWRGYIRRVNPSANDDWIRAVLVLIGLISVYAGVSQILALARG